MSTFFLADRIKELSRTETAGPIVLDGAVAGFSSFGDFYASGDVVFYAITDNTEYEVGSGIYEPNGGNRVITRNPLRSSNINSGPYYVNGDETDGPAGYYYPLYLTRSAAQSGVSFADGPYTNVSELTFTEFPGVTFYRPSEHAGYSATVGISGSNYNTLSLPIDFNTGVKEVFVTYPGKSSVFNGYGLEADVSEPKDSGIAFWRNEQILNYSKQIVWDETNNRLGVVQPNPQYALDIGGDRSRSILNVSGIIEGGSGILFSGGQPTYTGDTASGGRQLEPFLRHELGSGSLGVIEFSGIVDQYIGIAKQTPGTVFAGPETDHCGVPPCDPDYPTFRLLTLADLPLSDLTSSGGFIIQDNLGLDSQTANISPNNYHLGMVAIYAGSGGITYDSGILFDYNNNRLLVGGDASVDTPTYTLDARGTIGSQSGYLNQLIFTDDLIRIGAEAGTDDGNLTENYYLVGLGNSAGKGVSGIFDGLFAGRFAGLNSDTGSGIVMIGVSAGQASAGITESLGIGTDALRSADTILSGVMVGATAGQTMVSGTNVVAIGPRAMITSTEFSEVVAIGSSAAKDASGIYNSVVIGNSTALSADELASGVAIGFGAASGSVGTDNVVAIGQQAAASINDSSDVIALGSQAAMNASGTQDSINIGRGAGTLSSGTKDSISIGRGAGVSSSGIQDSINIGRDAGVLSSGTQDSISIGRGAGVSSSGIQDSISIGRGAGVSSSGIKDSINIGRDAGVLSSGDNHIFIGQGAGYASSGNGNIEITNSGTLINGITSDKINIGGIVVGDTSVSKLSIGSPSGLDPLATLTVEPASADDIAFIVRTVGSGHPTAMALQSGDGTSFYHITNSGDVITSGCINPSGGLLLESITPADWMNSTTNRLYNDAGTLKFNGSTITVGGAYSWNLTNGLTVPDEITDAQNVMISGVSGIVIEYETTTNRMIISGSGLSGVLQPQITASNYKFSIGASGLGANNNTTDQMDTNSYLMLSGINGIEIDYIDRDDATNHSGIFEISYNPSSFYSWFATNGDVADDEILDSQVITVSGVSGVRVEYDPATNFFRVGASGLSGVLQDGIDANLGYLSNEHGPISVSGLSGIAAYASGQVDSISQAGATSGLIQQNSNYIMDPDGSGNLSVLSFPNNSGRVVLRGDATTTTLNQGGTGCVIIGNDIGAGLTGTNSTSIVAIGSHAFGGSTLGDRTGMVVIGANAFDNEPAGSTINSIAIGVGAADWSSGTYNLSIGYQAGKQSPTEPRLTAGSIDIGYQAGYYQHYTASTGAILNLGYQAGMYATSGYNIINIGTFAGKGDINHGCRNNENLVNVGRNAGANQKLCKDTVNIGDYAGNRASGLADSIMIGQFAGMDISGVASTGNFTSIGIGQSALGAAFDLRDVVAIGQLAGSYASGIDKSVLIGRQAGAASSGTSDSVLIGYAAGYKRANNNSLIINVDSTFPSPYDADWSDYDEQFILDIGHVIQGRMGTTPNIHIGAELNSTYRTLSEINAATVNITPGSTSDSALGLFLHSTDGSNSSQVAGLMKTQTKDGSTIRSTLNEIINQDGYLRIPVATGITGSYPNKVLISEHGDEIIPGPGVIAIFEFSRSNHGLCFCLDVGGAYTWFKHAVTSILS